MDEHTASTPAKFYLSLILTIWFVIALILSLMGVFQPEPTDAPSALLLGALLPPFLFIIAYLLLPAVKEFALSLDLKLLTAIQAWRVIGVMFLILNFFNLLPAIFAWPAGVGDVIVGIAAPFILMALIHKKPNWMILVILLNVVGLLDFVGAFISGIASGTSQFGVFIGSITSDIMLQFPLSLIPTFGVPFWIILHIISLLQIYHIKRGDVAQSGF